MGFGGLAVGLQANATLVPSLRTRTCRKPTPPAHHEQRLGAAVNSVQHAMFACHQQQRRAGGGVLRPRHHEELLLRLGKGRTEGHSAGGLFLSAAGQRRWQLRFPCRSGRRCARRGCGAPSLPPPQKAASPQKASRRSLCRPGPPRPRRRAGPNTPWPFGGWVQGFGGRVGPGCLGGRWCRSGGRGETSSGDVRDRTHAPRVSGAVWPHPVLPDCGEEVLVGGVQAVEAQAEDGAAVVLRHAAAGGGGGGVCKHGLALQMSPGVRGAARRACCPRCRPATRAAPAAAWF